MFFRVQQQPIWSTTATYTHMKRFHLLAHPLKIETTFSYLLQHGDSKPAATPSYTHAWHTSTVSEIRATKNCLRRLAMMATVDGATSCYHFIVNDHENRHCKTDKAHRASEGERSRSIDFLFARPTTMTSTLCSIKVASGLSFCLPFGFVSNDTISLSLNLPLTTQKARYVSVSIYGKTGHNRRNSTAKEMSFM